MKNMICPTKKVVFDYLRDVVISCMYLMYSFRNDQKLFRTGILF